MQGGWRARRRTLHDRKVAIEVLLAKAGECTGLPHVSILEEVLVLSEPTRETREEAAATRKSARLVAEAPNWSDAPFPEWRVRNDLYSKLFVSFEDAVCLNGDLPRREFHLDNVGPRDGGSAAKCLRRLRTSAGETGDQVSF